MMQRAGAAFLVCIITFPLIGPALFADPEADLPACCRRNGKHHCAMMNMDPDPPGSGPTARAPVKRCPFFPKSSLLLPRSGPALPSVSCPVYVASLAQLTVEAQAEAGYRIAIGRSHQKRGPPILLS